MSLGIVLKRKIQSFIYNHRMLKYWSLVISRCGNRQWVNDVTHVWNSIDSIIAEHRGDRNRGEILCDIQCNGPTGFMGTVMSVLYYLWYADRFNMKPVVTAHNELYEENVPINGATQFWEYYFMPCSKFSPEDLANSFTVVSYKGKDFTDLGRFWGQDEARTYRISERAIVDLGCIYRKYVHLNKPMEEKIKKDINMLLNKKRTLGVHIRRGDMTSNCDHHPVVPELSDFIDATDKALKETEYEQIFVASSDKEVISVFRKQYGNRMITYDDIVRTEGMQAVWEVKDNREFCKYMSGVDVLRDVYTLVACSGFVSGLSNVSAMARIIKSSINDKYEYTYTIDKGINKNNKRAETLVEKQVNNMNRR